MATSSTLNKFSVIDRFMLSASGLYIVSFLFLTRTMTFGLIEYGVLALTLISIATILGKAFVSAISRQAVLVDIFLLLVAGFVAVRYGLAFVTDLNHFVTLLLFVATVGFAVVLVLSIRQLVSRVNQIRSADTSNTSERIPPTIDESLSGD